MMHGMGRYDWGGREGWTGSRNTAGCDRQDDHKGIIGLNTAVVGRMRVKRAREHSKLTTMRSNTSQKGSLQLQASRMAR